MEWGFSPSGRWEGFIAREGDLTSKMDGPSHVEASSYILHRADKKHLLYKWGEESEGSGRRAEDRIYEHSE